MTVQELIDLLNKIKDKSKEVVYDNYLPINAVWENEDNEVSIYNEA